MSALIELDGERLCDARVLDYLTGRSALPCEIARALPYTDVDVRASLVRLEHAGRIERAGGGWRARTTSAAATNLTRSAAAVATALLTLNGIQ